LGKLGVETALPTLLARLASCDDEAMAAELALAVARILGNERGYIRLARDVRKQPGTTIAQSLANTRRHLPRSLAVSAAALTAIEDDFARDQLDRAALAFGAWLAQLPPERHETVTYTVLRATATMLQKQGYQRPEYVLLGLHAVAARPSE
jgi:hypothetical protein